MIKYSSCYLLLHGRWSAKSRLNFLQQTIVAAWLITNFRQRNYITLAINNFTGSRSTSKLNPISTSWCILFWCSSVQTVCVNLRRWLLPVLQEHFAQPVISFFFKAEGLNQAQRAHCFQLLRTSGMEFFTLWNPVNHRYQLHLSINFKPLCRCLLTFGVLSLAFFLISSFFITTLTFLFVYCVSGHNFHVCMHCVGNRHVRKLVLDGTLFTFPVVCIIHWRHFM